MARNKKAKLRGHAREIRSLGGKARMESMSDKERSEFASAGGKAGGKARAEKLSSKRRSEIARAAAEARWKKKQQDSEPSEE
jgi:hypothetical protein